MNTYRARFSAPAMVTVEFEVQAETQQDGLVAAHDLIRQASLSGAKIVSVSLDSAVNTGFERVTVLQAEPTPANKALDGSFFVECFDGQHCTGAAVASGAFAEFVQAQQFLRLGLSNPFSGIGSGRVLDAAGLVLASENADRGGWEVELRDTQTALVTVLSRKSWIPSQKEAISSAMVSSSASTNCSVAILDYTCRIRGPVLWKEIQ